jgi:hypothetical protein
LIRLELRYLGRQEEKILQAKTEGLESERILAAMAQRAEWESEQLAARIIGNTNALPAPAPVIRGFGAIAPQTSQHLVSGKVEASPKA